MLDDVVHSDTAQRLSEFLQSTAATSSSVADRQPRPVRCCSRRQARARSREMICHRHVLRGHRVRSQNGSDAGGLQGAMRA